MIAYVLEFAQKWSAMENWDEVRTAYQVARMGTVSGAADVLGVHHATVIRHIDALEERVGVKLFQRHARGYTPTEAGDDLFRVAQATDDQFSQLLGRIKGRGHDVSGELVITSLAYLSDLVTPVLAAFQQEHPDVTVRYLTGARLFRLEYGEAHVAIRSGSPPEQPDNVVQAFVPQNISLYAAKSYIEKFGTPKSEADLAHHRFVTFDDQGTRAPFMKWLRGVADESQFAFRTTDDRSMYQAVAAGAGLGFLSESQVRNTPNLVEVFPSRDDWQVPHWLVTHVDLHRTTKVQAFLKFLKSKSKNWDAQ
jgi:DNA-binding transcriptional LysR family regulator